MMPDYTTNVLIIVGLALLILLLWLVTRRKSAETKARFRKVSKAYLSDFLIPDGQGGQILIEHALLCPRGIVIIDAKDVEGNIFGSDAMHDWTVITGKSRFTFANPQPGLFDRTAAVAHLLPDVPVSGFVAFSDRGKFTKGLPGHVVNLNELLKELAGEAKSKSEALDAYWPSWEKLRAESVVAQVARLIED
jgi:LPXTG-motif cell wall-anchored protein